MADNGTSLRRTGKTALIVEVPASEPLVQVWRNRFDAAAVAGSVPPHVTVLYPFLDGGLVDDGVLNALAGIFARHRVLDLRFDRCGRFPDVLYLAPEPAAPLRALTEAVTERWPEAPPFGGEFTEIIPHLSVAKDQPPDVFDTIEVELSRQLPIAAHISAVDLLVPVGGRFHHECSFPLAEQ